MNYKFMRHVRGKSDTNFYYEKSLLDGAYSSLKVLNVNLVGDIEKSHGNINSTQRKSPRVKKPKKPSNVDIHKLLTSSVTDKNELILRLLERVLLFKKELDEYFFKDVKCLKSHLDNLLLIINQQVISLQEKLITECPRLSNNKLIKLFSVFSEVINSFKDTEPQDFYREIKDAIINQWEGNRIKIKELLDDLKDNNSGLNQSDSSSSNNNITLTQDFMHFNNSNNNIISINNDLNIHLNNNSSSNNINNLINISNKNFRKRSSFLSVKSFEDEEENKNEDVVTFLLSKKKEIIHFLFELSQGFFFIISKLYYEMDYYSNTISSLGFKIFCCTISFINSNKDNKQKLNEQDLQKQKKIYHIIDHIINLARIFNKSVKLGEISLENGSLNSMCKFIINNFVEIIPKCKGIKDPEMIKKFNESSLFQNSLRKISYKCYMQRYKKFNDNQLLRIFRFYYNSKLVFWKSIVSFNVDDTATFCCRICEKKIPLNDSCLHVNYCKEQKSFYEKMMIFQNNFQNYINDLDIYLTKINQNLNQDAQSKKIFSSKSLLYKIINALPGCKDDESGEVFLKSLIKIYKYERNKPLNYYENKPEDLSYFISLGYFTLILFVFCKLSEGGGDQELNGILGGVFTLLLQNMINIQFFLFLRKSKIKNNVIKGEKPAYKKPLQKFKSYETKQMKDIINVKKKKTNESTSVLDEDNDIVPSFNFRAFIQKYKSKLSLNNMILSHNSSQNNLKKSKKNNRVSSNCSNHSKKNKKETSRRKREKYKSMNKDMSAKEKNKMINIVPHNVNYIGSPKKPKKLKKSAFCFDFNKESSGKELENLSMNVNSKNQSKNNSVKRKSTTNLNGEKRETLFKEKEDKDINNKDNKNNKDIKDKNNTNNNNTNLNEQLVIDDLDIKRHNKTKSCGNIYFDNETEDKSKNKEEKDKSVDSSVVLCTNNTAIPENASFYSETEFELEPILSSVNTSPTFTSLMHNYYSGNKNNSNNNENKSLNNSYLQRFVGENKPIFSPDVSSIHKKAHNIQTINSNNCNKKSLFGNLLKKNFYKSSNKGDESVKSTLFLHQNIYGVDKLKKESKSCNTSKSKSKDLNSSNVSIISNSNGSILQSENEHSSEEDKEKNKNIDDINSNSNKDSSELSDESENDDILNGNFEENKEEKNLNGSIKRKKSLSKLYTDPETEKMIKDGKITDIYEELIKNLDGDLIVSNFENNNNNNNNIINNENNNDKNNVNLINKEKTEDKKVQNNLETNNSIKNNSSDKKEKNDFDINANINTNNNNNIIIHKEKDDNKKENITPKKEDKESNDKINEKNKKNSNNEIEQCKVSKKAKISAFKLILPLAKGGYGSVALYKKITTGDYYAIKTVHINAMKEKKLSNTLKTEQKILREVDNDYVVNSYFIFQDEKNYYFVMEYLPGGDVYNLLSSIILPEDTIQLIVAETILAINYLHRIKIIHHDIKPENILITKEGHFKLSDFGLSKSLDDKTEKDSKVNVRNLPDYLGFNKENNIILDDVEETTQAVGTLNYMAPELFTDEFPKGAGIDYWAVGVVIYELYTFKVPFEGKTQQETIDNIIGIKVNWEPMMSEDLRSKYKNIDAAIDLIKKFLLKNPDDRWDDRNLYEIKKHSFFKNFNWEHINSIRSPSILKYLKKLVDETNKKIKQANNLENNKDKKEDFPLLVGVNLTENEEDFHFTERLDNLNRRNNELIRMKLKKKEIKIEDNNLIESTRLDLEF